MNSTATISDDGKYRYRLARSWDSSLAALVFIMLNPSTADASDDDPTIRKCIGFASRNGFGGIEVYNLFALRSTNPSALAVGIVDAVIGPKNDDYLNGIGPNRKVVVAWGAGKNGIELQRRIHDRSKAVLALLQSAPLCLGKTKSGYPRHPLMLGYTTKLEPFSC